MNDRPDPARAADLEAFRARAFSLILRSLAEARVDARYRASMGDLVSGWLEQSRNRQPILDLPGLVSQAAGSEAIEAAPGGAAWWLMQFAAKLFDDVEDGDLTEGLAQSVNLASAALVAAQATLLGSVWSPAVAERSSHVSLEFARACLLATAGQHLDLTAPEDIDPDTWLSIARSKSGALLGWAAWAGAIAAGCDGETSRHYWRFGEWLGVLIQVADDFSDTWRPASRADLTFQRPSLAVAYGQLVSQGEKRAQLQHHLSEARDGDAASAAQLRDLLTSLGAQAFLLAAAEQCRREARSALELAGGSESDRVPLLTALALPLSSIQSEGA